MRSDGRKNDEIRPVRLEVGFIENADGSCLITQGKTRVICTASIEFGVPPFLEGSGRGWLTAEYGMLPRSTHTRSKRRLADGRSQEIQRLIGRSLRAVLDLGVLANWTILVDCDVIQADGGTRTASVSGAYVAASLAFAKMRKRGDIKSNPFREPVAAISAGVVDGIAMIDLCYAEDSQADVDANFVMTGSGKFVEVQGTAEHHPFGKEMLDQLAELASRGIAHLITVQQEALTAAGIRD
jgi:ribonuclease PH